MYYFHQLNETMFIFGAECNLQLYSDIYLIENYDLAKKILIIWNYELLRIEYISRCGFEVFLPFF